MVVKVRPVNVWRSRMDGVPMEQIEAQILNCEFAELPIHVLVMPANMEINTYSLFDAIDFGLTVRRTIGMELSYFGVPVVAAVIGCYSAHGFTTHPSSREHCQKILSRLHERVPLGNEQRLLERQYAFGAFYLRPYPTISFQLDFYARSFGIAALKQSVVLDTDQMERWPDIHDLAQITHWAAEARSADLLLAEPDEFVK